MSHGRFEDPVSAALAGFLDLFRKQPLAERLTEADRYDGRTVLITGANSGLGFALAVEAARRDGSVLMACRSGHPDAGEAVRAASGAGSARVAMRHLDLSDLDSLHAFVDGLVRDGIVVDVLFLNAATTLPEARRTRSGQDEMFLVNYLANFVLVNLLLDRGILLPGRPDSRIIFISSDSHQGASAIDYTEFGRFFAYGVRKAIANYSYFKLLLNTFAMELARRLDGGDTRLAVHVICPGPVNTNIIKEAPPLLRMVLRAIFTVIFAAPAKAARAPIYLSLSGDYEGRTGDYLHMFAAKRMDPKVYDVEAGRKLWDASLALWKSVDVRAREGVPSAGMAAHP